MFVLDVFMSALLNERKSELENYDTVRFLIIKELGKRCYPFCPAGVDRPFPIGKDEGIVEIDNGA